MAVLINVWLNAEKLEQLAAGLKTKGEKGISATIAINDEVNDYGQNAVAYIAPSAEQKEKGKKPFYFGNGKATWQDGKLTIVKYEDGENVPHEYIIDAYISDEIPSTKDEPDDLPF